MKILFLIFCLSINCVVFSQSKNQQRISQINTEIQSAIDNQDFDKAKTLKIEKDIRIEIEETITNGDFDKAEKLKNSLDNNQPSNQSYQIVEPSQESRQDDVLTAKTNVYNRDSYQLNKSIKRGVYLDLNIGGGGLSSAYGGGWGTNLGFDVGVRIGKYDYHKRYRLIFDLEFVNFSVLFGGGLYLYNPYYEPDTYFNYQTGTYELVTNNSTQTRTDYAIGVGVIKPGITFSYATNQKMGIEASMHIGTHINYFPIEYGNGEGGDFGAVGFEFDPRFIFRINKLGVGVKFVYASFFDLSSNNAGWGNSFRITPTIGFKF